MFMSLVKTRLHRTCNGSSFRRLCRYQILSIIKKKTKGKKTQCFQYIVDSDICFPISHQFSETVPILVCSSLLMLKCPQYAKRQQDYFFNIRTVTFDHNGTFVDMNRSMCNFNSFSFFLQYSCSTGFARD